MKGITTVKLQNHEGKLVILQCVRHNNRTICYKEEPESEIPGGAEKHEISQKMYDSILKYSHYKELERSEYRV